MSKKLDLEYLKKEYVDKQINWLTILDVFHSAERKLIMFRCRCKCGRDIEVSKSYLLNNRVMSCGCYRHSTEKANKYKQWCKNNPDKVKEKTETRSNTLKENPDIIVNQGYVKCSICVTSGNSCITTDSNIYKRLKE